MSVVQALQKAAREAVLDVLRGAIVYKARLNKSGKSFYVYLPRRYNNILEKWHEEKREVKVIIMPVDEDVFKEAGRGEEGCHRPLRSPARPPAEPIPSS